MLPSFHLSLPVRSVEESAEFFTVLGGSVVHRDPSGYVNVDLFGVQLTLTPGDPGGGSDFHFGVNLPAGDFDKIAQRLLADSRVEIVSPPHVVDAGTPMERRKMYVRCPSGYLVELKGLPG